MQELNEFLQQLLDLQQMTVVVDIGANPIDGDPPYKGMLENRLCRVIGFEPQQQALQALLERKGELETYLPYAIGDGGQHTLYQCQASGMTSLYKPDPRYLGIFNDFEELGRVVSTQPVATQRLDDVTEIGDFDMLKIDIQGMELDVFRSGRQKLAHAVAIQTEVSFMPLYEDQPLFWEIDKELREQGFVPHTFTAVKRWPVAPYSHPRHQRVALNQLLEADVVYVRDFVNPESMTDQQLRHLAMIMHHCYQSHDIVSRCLSILVSRGALSPESLKSYRRHLFPGHRFEDDPAPVNYSVSFNI